MNAFLSTRAMALAGAYTGLILYALCLAFFLLVYNGPGDWMIQPFMPGVTTTLGGYLLGFVWAAAYGAGIPWLLAVLYNRGLRREAAETPA